MDPANRIKYDTTRGAWRVIHGGKEQDVAFKSSGEAFAHLKSLLHPPVKS